MAASTDFSDSQVGELRSSKFRILGPLGAGGMGAVFRAEHILTKRVGALKVLYRSMLLLPNVVERFMREASAAGRVNSPHIVETFDAGHLDSGQPYIFMELLSGVPLDQYLEAHRRVPLNQALGICIQAASGLVEAHESGIIHRDIKPANLFLVNQPGTLVKLLDFGISKFQVREDVSSLTQEGTILGTPHYMPYEQLMGALEVDAGADIYALGVVLYECISGELPFQATTLPELGVKVHLGKFRALSETTVGIPAGLEALVARCLSPQRQARFENMRELLAELVRLASDHSAQTGQAVSMGPAAPVIIAGPAASLDGILATAATSVAPPGTSGWSVLPGGTVAAPQKQAVNSARPAAGNGLDSSPPNAAASTSVDVAQRRGVSPVLLGALAVGALGFGAWRLMARAPVDAAEENIAAEANLPELALGSSDPKLDVPAAMASAEVPPALLTGETKAQGSGRHIESNSALANGVGATSSARIPPEKAVSSATTTSVPPARPNIGNPRASEKDGLKRENPFD